jgi:glycosyltransferase involved in cell wall biosynthesis/SAM-dependent methyltransferase
MKICIVAHYAYGALTGEESGHIGGVERQTALLSEWLAANGHEVIVITWDEGGSHPEIIKNIKIMKLCKITDGFPLIRFFTPRWYSLIKALKQSDADLYYHNCAEYVTGQIALWAKMNNKPFIYTVASDADCEAHLPKLQTKRDRLLFLYGLRNANKIICQTNKQKKMLAKNYNLVSQVIPMPGTPAKGRPDSEHQFNQRKVIWVGRIQTVKRIEWLIDIAEKLPDVSFEVIGPNNHNYEYTENILPRASKVTNIKFLGKICRDEMPNIYKNATLLLNTSIYEGFPNTFLEAWSYGVPTVCSVDPDDIINSHNLGYATIIQEELTEALKKLVNNRQQWKQCSLNSIRYYTKNHSLDQVQRKFEQEFLAFSYEKKTQKYFNQKSKRWGEYYNSKANSISHLDLQTRVEYAIKYLSSSTMTSKDVLVDVGCGTGNGTVAFRKKIGCITYGVDFANEMIKKAKSQHVENIYFQVADASKLPFENKLASSLVSLGTLEYIPNYQDALNEFNRVLKSNGQLIFSVPNKHSLFRKLRNIGKKLIRPIQRLRNKSIDEQEYHKQWYPTELTNELVGCGFAINESNFFTYGFLNPKLVHTKANIKLCCLLNKKIKNTSVFAKYLAHSIIVNANKTNDLNIKD